MNKYTPAVRGVRKSANIARRALIKVADLSGRVEKKADRIIHGVDPKIKLHDTMLFEQIYYEALPEITPLHPSLPIPGRSANVTLLIPSLQKSSFFGGTSTALVLASKLATRTGRPLRIVETIQSGGVSEKELSLYLKKMNVLIDNSDISLINVTARRYNKYGYIDIHPDDIFIASAWWDAHLVQKLPLLKPFIYLIQDYEPIFYNNSDMFVLAEQTYRSVNFIPVCNTKLMHTFMSSMGYTHIEKNGLWFEPAIITNHSDHATTRTREGGRRMFLYGRPSVDRNLFYFALDCINEVFYAQHLDGAEWEIITAGQDNIPDIILESGMKISNLGKLSLDDYHELIRTVDVAISPMLAPHPNYPTLEFSSTGSVVVTTRYATKTDLSNYSKNIIVSDLDKDSFVSSIIKASKFSIQRRIKNAKNSNMASNWDDSLHQTIDAIAVKLSV